ncbi:MAG: copper resistance protein CopC [Psychromonas sp.]|nr:copper resistance protein CopC [Psychromonas sp.]
MKIFKIIAILSLLLLSNLASAHSHLKLTFPEYGATLNKPPEELIFEFTSQVKLVRLKLTTQSGKAIKLERKPSKEFETTINITLPSLDSGSYNVKWMAIGKDTHKMEGDFIFTINASSMTPPPAASGAAGHN